MSATLTTTSNTAHIRLSGNFDFSRQEELKTVFEQATQTESHTIKVDMEKVSFIDSAVIRLLLKLREAANRHKKSLVIVRCTERVGEIFAIGGFDKIFDIR
jgi:anti-anti-sigma factor